MNHFRIALAQINPTVGDLGGNADLIRDAVERARRARADMVVLPELAITGYPPEDLLMRTAFVEDNLAVLQDLTAECAGITVIVGFVDREDDIYNSAGVIHNGSLLYRYHKQNLPNYGVFDEFRYFQRGKETPVFDLGAIRFGVNICEDIWVPNGPLGVQALAGAELIVNINASPYHMGKVGARERMVSVRAADHGVYVAYLNMVGGQDELVFDGGSRVVGPGGETVAEAPLFEEALLIVDIDPGLVLAGRLRDSRRRAVARKLDPSSWIPVELPPLKTGETDAGTREALAVQPSARLTVLEKARRALVLGTRDYVEKNRFRDVLVAVSGGVDSALVAALAVEALGAGRVRGVFMPSEYTSDESREDAEKLAENLGIRLDTISIATIFEAYRDELKAVFGPAPPDVTEENLQARIRGDLIMALSNKWGSLVLTTGNKSEMSVGYATLYGDMAGGFAVIKDVPKLLVYDLCRLINQGGQGPAIPERILTKAPTAELRPGQKDTDSLPPYPVLDPIIKAYVEDEVRDVEVGEGCDTGCIERVIGLIDRAEYKRRQAPPGVKITPRAFGRDRRMPITNRYGLSGKDSDKDNDKK